MPGYKLKLISLNLIIILSTWLDSSTARAVDCTHHPIYCSILKVNPKVDKKLAMELSNYIYKYSKIYKIDPLRSVAIAAQESMFRRLFNTEDLGIFQLNTDTLLMYGKDPSKVKESLEYSVATHMWLLNKKKSYCKDTEYPWACYHSSTPKYYNKYVKAVNKYYNQIIGDMK